jgi:hypothetical protein
MVKASCGRSACPAHPLSGISGATNAVTFVTKLLGR